MKSVLRSFEMVSSLKINFWKNCLMGVNVQDSFLQMTADFLHCRIGALFFNYLDLFVGASLKRLQTWQPMNENLRRRLNGWRNRYVSFRGRIVYINSVLNSIPTFYLSFMKMPIKVWKDVDVVSIQRDFLWGGLNS